MTFFCFVVISRRTPSGRQTDRVGQHRPSTFAGVQRVFAAGYANEYENENCVNGHGSLHTPAQMLAHTHTHTQTHVTGLCCNIVGASRLSIDITLSSRSSDYNAHMWRMRNAAKPSRPSPVESMLGRGGGGGLGVLTSYKRSFFISNSISTSTPRSHMQIQLN